MSPEVTLAVLVSAVLFVYAISAHDTNFRSKRNAPGMPNWLSQMDRSSTDGMSRGDMSALIPAVPSESEVNCQMEYEVVRTVGGRCVRLGGRGRTASCQSGMYLDVRNEECENILRAREFQSAQDDQNHDLQHRQVNNDSSGK